MKDSTRRILIDLKHEDTSVTHQQINTKNYRKLMGMLKLHEEEQNYIVPVEFMGAMVKVIERLRIENRQLKQEIHRGNR